MQFHHPTRQIHTYPFVSTSINVQRRFRQDLIFLKTQKIKEKLKRSNKLTEDDRVGKSSCKAPKRPKDASLPLLLLRDRPNSRKSEREWEEQEFEILNI